MHQHRVGGGVSWAVAAVLTAGALAGCAGDEATESPAGVSAAATPRATAGPFDAATFVPAGYQVLTTTPMALGRQDRPDYQVVISAAKDAVEGGTQNVQVFAYDTGAWAEVFDAGDDVVPYELQVDFGAPEPDRSLDPVLNQEHRLDGVAVELVRFAGAHPALVIHGEDKSESHILGLLGVVDFLGEQANLDHYEMAQDLGRPKVIGPADAQELEVPNYWYPWLGGGDPTEYTQTVGLADDGGVTVLADSRPWLGAWVGVGAGPGVTVSETIEGSPAADVLSPGDRILSVDGNNPEQGLGADLLTKKPGEEITLKVDRGGELSDKTLTLSDLSRAPTFWQSPGPATIGVEVAPLSGRKGIAITRVTAGSAAAAAGLTKTDAIVRVGEFEMGDPADLDAALSGRAGQELEFEVQRTDGTTETVPVTPTAGDDTDSLVALL